MFSLFASNLFTHSVIPDIVAPETIIVKGVLKTIDSDNKIWIFLLSWLAFLLQYFRYETFSNVVANYFFLSMPPDRLDIVKSFLSSIILRLACLSPCLLFMAKS